MANGAPTIGADGPRRLRASHWLGTLALHAGLVAAILLIRQPQREKETIAISIVEPKREDKPPPPPPPPAVVEDAPAATAPRKQPATAARPQSDTDSQPATAPPTIGLRFSNGGDGSLAAPTGGGGGPPAATAPALVRKTLAPAAPAAPSGDCAEPLQKAKPKSVPQPAYPEAARSAQVEGRVRIEVTLDASGKVTGARVVAGLGHGLDEAALAAARSASFAPAMRCGRAVSSTFVIGMRFTL